MSSDRQEIIALIDEARKVGVRQNQACDALGISARTLQRWKRPEHKQDGRILSKHVPKNKLTELECQRLLKLVNVPEYANLAPNQIVPILADKGQYIASESSIYRLLKAHKQLQHREKSKAGQKRNKPLAQTATAPNQIYTWDITYLPSQVKGLFFYLYLVLDVYSRKVVGWQVHRQERSALAADMMKDICYRENISRHQVILHSDNGSPMKGATMLATLQELGIMPSFSRPSVSNDNPYSESLFRTLKYRPEYPEKPFESLMAARNWVRQFVQWYNQEHRHSAIKFVTPNQRHNGEDIALLAKRKRLYEAAKSRNPSRWTGETRNWRPVREVKLNPDKAKSEPNPNVAA